MIYTESYNNPYITLYLFLNLDLSIYKIEYGFPVSIVNLLCVISSNLKLKWISGLFYYYEIIEWNTELVK